MQRKSTLEIVIGNILDVNADVIVNSWNMNLIPWWMLLPQGVSGAIKRRAGVRPFIELSKLGIIRPGNAVVTSGGNLACQAIIHVASLNCLWCSTYSIVQKCIEDALRIADEKGYRSIAFPLVGAGTGGLDSGKVEQIIVEKASASTYSGHIIIVRRR
ncbi:MAG: Appr-1-p processing protein [Betaproteobacteria bacterium]|nr:Appr-1-p processing protein [Betaproteobacteria bacterium]